VQSSLFSRIFARSLARMAAGAAILWLVVVAVHVTTAVLGIDVGVALPALNGAAFLAATYLMVRLLARRLAGDE
jgi:hypothetical protein